MFTISRLTVFSSESIFVNYTRKHAQVVTSLQQVVTNLFTSTNKLLPICSHLQTSCYQSVHIYKQVVTNLFTSTNKLLPICSHLQTSCYQSVHIYKQVVTNLFTSTNKLLPICSHLQTSCYQAVDKLSSHCLFPVVGTSLEQAVNNL